MANFSRNQRLRHYSWLSDLSIVYLSSFADSPESPESLVSGDSSKGMLRDVFTSKLSSAGILTRRFSGSAVESTPSLCQYRDLQRPHCDGKPVFLTSRSHLYPHKSHLKPRIQSIILRNSNSKTGRFQPKVARFALIAREVIAIARVYSVLLFHLYPIGRSC